MDSSIKKLRDGAGMTQEQLAKAVGVHAQTIYNWEKGRTDIKSSDIKNLATALHCSIEQVIGEPEAGDLINS